VPTQFDDGRCWCGKGGEEQGERGGTGEGEFSDAIHQKAVPKGPARGGAGERPGRIGKGRDDEPSTSRQYPWPVFRAGDPDDFLTRS
jgi:hypothetical protein